jgi:hypothetical protein
MNIDQQLRAALSQEAEMKTAPAPDVDRLIIGGKVRQRRRNRTRVGVAAAVAVLVAGGAYGVTKNDHTTAVGPAGKPPQTNASHTCGDPGVPTIQPGTCRMLVGENDAGAALYATITFDNTDWQNGYYPVLLAANSNGGVAVYWPVGLAAGTGCASDDRLNTNLGDTPQSLAQQLAQLPQSTVLQSPTPVQAFGRDAIHLRLRINNNCGPGVYRVAQTTRGDHGITYDPVRAVVIDFWVVDHGKPVVVETWHEINSPRWLVDDIAHTKDSITLESGG